MLLTLKQISDATNGKTTSFAEVTGISTDTRTINKGDLYIALRGERFDGHDYIDKAFENGASVAIVEVGYNKTSGNRVLIEVESSKKALQSLLQSRFSITA